MTEYLRFEADVANPAFVSAFDELPLWSAMAGLLLVHHVELRRGMRVLDVGCGTGFPSIELAERLGPGGTVVGIDPWTAAVDRARFKAKVRGVTNLDLRVGDAKALPFETGTFDLITSNLGLNNFADPPAALAECRRVLAPTGRLALATNLHGNMREFYEVFESTLRELGRADEIDALQRHVEHRATMESLTALLESAGFAVTRTARRSELMRFCGGAALLRHWFIRIGFLPAWRDVVAKADRPEVFARLEAELDRVATKRGSLDLTIPLAFVEAKATAR